MIAELESLGYGAFWFGEAPGGKEAFTRAATLLAASSSIVVGTGIASIPGPDAGNKRRYHLSQFELVAHRIDLATYRARERAPQVLPPG